MRFDTSQQMRMGQQMKLAPRMIQSMEILQMALPELEERIEQELESNATLELTEGSGEPADSANASSDGELGGDPRRDDNDSAHDSGVSDAADLTIGENGSSEDFSRLGSMEDEYADDFAGDYGSDMQKPDRFADRP